MGLMSVYSYLLSPIFLPLTSQRVYNYDQIYSLNRVITRQVTDKRFPLAVAIFSRQDPWPPIGLGTQLRSGVWGSRPSCPGVVVFHRRPRDANGH